MCYIQACNARYGSTELHCSVIVVYLTIQQTKSADEKIFSGNAAKQILHRFFVFFLYFFLHIFSVNDDIFNILSLKHRKEFEPSTNTVTSNMFIFFIKSFLMQIVNIHFYHILHCLYTHISSG